MQTKGENCCFCDPEKPQNDLKPLKNALKPLKNVIFQENNFVYNPILSTFAHAKQ